MMVNTSFPSCTSTQSGMKHQDFKKMKFQFIVLQDLQTIRVPVIAEVHEFFFTLNETLNIFVPRGVP